MKLSVVPHALALTFMPPIAVIVFAFGLVASAGAARTSVPHTP